MDTQTLGRDVAAAAGVVRVAVDAMGGDHAPDEVVHGALEWVRGRRDVELLLVGDRTRIEALAGELPGHVSIVHASESVAMEEHPAAAVRRKRDASINVCMRLVREQRADAVVTAGHTGAGVASAIVNLGRLAGVDRPALAVQMVTDRGPFVLLDIGATTDSTGHNLYQYAHMGTIYAERVLGVASPSVALLSIGEEGGKGEQRVREATELLGPSSLRFLGNVEGRDLPLHPADVVVCDATVGNVTIKFFEGLSSFIFDQLRTEFRRWPLGPFGYLLMRPGLGRIRRRFDYERLGGAPLLGVRGTVLITHGRARRRMIGFAVEAGAAAARARIPERIAAALTGEPAVDG
ncbi:MAG TPA: phosphate acyltransferase PlsX [Candidatus Limnocylindria bacterium]|jgi:phosphate acyltransferase|nr:phosphate acyltransferase PlsX [Candidatus Limnocylindria bacterium]